MRGKGEVDGSGNFPQKGAGRMERTLYTSRLYSE